MKSKSDANRASFESPRWKGSKPRAALGTYEWRAFLSKALRTMPSKRTNAQREAIEVAMKMALFPFSPRP